MSIVPKIVFIVPYKNRQEDKIHFSIYMRYIMEDYKDDDYEIYYSHQLENKPFSRGATKNIGFLAVKNKYPNDYKKITFVFNDVDTVPCEKNILNYGTKKGIIKHFYGFTYTLGGIFSITGIDYETCNGFPNLYGWGIEDNVMYDRAITHNIKINRDTFYDIKSNKIIHTSNTHTKLISNNDPANYNKKKLNDNLKNIYNLEYDIVLNNEKTIKKNNKEFMINIKKYTTEINPYSEKYYIQDLTKSNKLKPNMLEKQEVITRWSMNRLML